MRSTMMAVMLCVSLPACQGQVAGETASPSFVEGTGGGAASGSGAGSGGGGGAKGGGATSGAAGTTGSGSGWSNGQPPCMFGVTGAAEAWVDGPSNWGWAWLGGSEISVQCSGTVLGVDHEFIASLGALHGPGQYQAPSATYQRFACQGSSCSDMEGFGKQTAASTCTFDLTVAPEKPAAGAAVAGTFYCGPLADAGDPTRVVTVYDGSFSATLTPPPE